MTRCRAKVVPPTSKGVSRVRRGAECREGSGGSGGVSMPEPENRPALAAGGADRLGYGASSRQGLRLNMVRATAGLAAATAMLALSWFVTGRADPLPGEVAAPPRLAEPHHLNLVGSAGCNGVACHGGPVAGLVPPSAWGTVDADRDRWRSSYTVWRLYDPHHRAFEALGNDRSKEIETNLARGGEAVDARTDVRCLGCHTTPTLADQPSHPLRAEGVG